VSIAVVWLIIGIPALLLALVLFMDRSPWRAGLGYLVLAGGFVGLAALGDRASAAVFGAVLALVYAAGRGGDVERERTRDDEIGVPDVAVDEGHGHVGAGGT
jgi:uncharacterized membrane protein